MSDFDSALRKKFLISQFNRVHISMRDFKEATDYLRAFNRYRSALMRRALLLSAIISYARPFTAHNDAPKNRGASSRLPIKIQQALSADELLQHSRLIKLRNEALAHSEISRKPTSYLMSTGNGFLVKSAPFDVLTESIDHELFVRGCLSLIRCCELKLFELNDEIGKVCQ